MGLLTFFRPADTASAVAHLAQHDGPDLVTATGHDKPSPHPAARTLHRGDTMLTARTILCPVCGMPISATIPPEAFHCPTRD